MRLTSIDWRGLTDLATLKRRVARAPTSAWVVVALVPPLVAGGLLVAAFQSEQLAHAREQAIRVELDALRVKAAATPAVDTTPFAARLPLAQSSARVVTHLREAAESQSVLVTAISTSTQAATVNTLGRMSLDVNLRGSYVAIKTVLAELLTRDSQQAVLQQLSLRRATSAAGGLVPNTMNAAQPMGVPPSGELEARVLATWLSRPLTDKAFSASATPAPPAPPFAAPSKATPATPASAAAVEAPASSASRSTASEPARVASAPAVAASFPRR